MAKKNDSIQVEENSIEYGLRGEIDSILQKSSYHSLKSPAEFDVQYPTGFFPLDYRNGQRIHVQHPDGHETVYDSVGIVDGSINKFIGRSGSGKSTLAKQMAANIVAPFENGLIFEDSVEGGIVSRRNEILTGFSPSELDRRLKFRNAGVTIENIYHQIKAIHDVKMQREDKYRYNTGLLDYLGRPIIKFQPTVYIVDSIAMLAPEKLTTEEEMSGQMSTTASAKMLAQLFRRITPMLKEANIIFFGINHITSQVSINPMMHQKTDNAGLKQGESLPGGKTPLYLANNIFRLDDGAKLTSDKEFGIDGCHVTISLVKSRTASTGVSSAVDMIFNFDTGFDADLSMYMMLKNAGVVNGAGAFLYFGDRSDKKFSQRQLKEKLATDPEFAQIFASECVKYFNQYFDNQELRLKNNQSVATNIISAMIKKQQG